MSVNVSEKAHKNLVDSTHTIGRNILMQMIMP